MGMPGFAAEIFAQLRSLGRLSLIRVKHSFYWLGFITHFMDYSYALFRVKNTYLQQLSVHFFLHIIAF